MRLLPLLLLLACKGDKDPASSDTGDLPDEDGDGYTTADDCDDADPGINPGVPELCDGINNDCDGAIDEPDSADASTYYRDSDGDGFGDPSITTAGCERPPGYQPDNTDCDDTSAAAWPGAEEICNDGADNDCDADQTDCRLEGVFPLSESQVLLTGAAAGDQAGLSLAAVGDVSGDGLADLLVGAPYHDGGETDRGGAFLVRGPLTSRSLSAADAALLGRDRSHNAGWSVASAGDVDADGYADVALGAPRADGDSLDAGEIYLLRGPLSGTVDLAAAAALLYGEETYSNAGYSLAAGDLTGDGAPDLLVGADRFGNDDLQYQGAAYLVSGPVTGSFDLAGSTARITGTHRYDRVGSALKAGDWDGDGIDDAAFGSGSYPENDGYGLVALALGPLAGQATIEEADALWQGESAGDQAGASLSVGDVDGDGYADILAGAPYAAGGAEPSGVAYLLLGGGAGPADLASADARLLGVSEDDEAGAAVACDGDFDGDGAAEVAVGAPGETAGGADAGAIYLLYGPLAGALDLGAAPLQLQGSSRVRAGAALTLAMDADGDGLMDLAADAPEDDAGGADAGSVWLRLGVGL